MATVVKGTALTCGHEGCGCQIRIDEVCNCPGGGAQYTCRCGAALTEKPGASDTGGGTDRGFRPACDTAYGHRSCG